MKRILVAIHKLRLVLVATLVALGACSPQRAQVIVITATFPDAVIVVIPAGTPVEDINEPQGNVTVMPTIAPLLTWPELTPDPTRSIGSRAAEHIVQPGDTLSAIAQRYNTSLAALLNANELPNPDILTVGQSIRLPDLPSQISPYLKLLPDSRLVRGPGSSAFDLAGFIQQQPGYIRTAQDRVSSRLANGASLDRVLNSVAVVERVSLEYSVDARILLALLEYRAGWLSRFDLEDEAKSHPLINAAASASIYRSGLYRQLSWAANELNRGYYSWKGRGLSVLEFADQQRVLLEAGLNPASAAIQYLFSLGNTINQWAVDISLNGFIRTYLQYFGDPFMSALDPLLPTNLVQPDLSLPFAAGEVWYYTGGPHGGWGSGSAWAALDFAPPDEWNPGMSLCFTSQYWVRAMADGVVARSGDGVLILDLDMDGDESTGWSILYLHLAAEGLLPVGTTVKRGDPVGKASCAGGFSTATHLHVARRFNGEWIAASCASCAPHLTTPDFVMDGWISVGIAGQEYQGSLERDGIQVRAEQGRETLVNRISW